MKRILELPETTGPIFVCELGWVIIKINKQNCHKIHTFNNLATGTLFSSSDSQNGHYC